MSQIFRPYRALGLVSERIPFALQHHGNETFITTSLGKNFHTYNVVLLSFFFFHLKLRLAFIFFSGGSTNTKWKELHNEEYAI